MPFIISFFKGKSSHDEEHEHNDAEALSNANFNYDFIHPNFFKQYIIIINIFRDYNSKEKDVGVLRKRISWWLQNYWHEFDSEYMKEILVHDWPNVFADQEIFKARIAKISEELKERKDVREMLEMMQIKRGNTSVIVNDMEKNDSAIKQKLLDDDIKL